MSDDQVKVSIIADAEGVQPGVNEAKQGVEGLASTVAGASEEMHGSFTTVSVAVHELGASIRETAVVVGEMREAVMAFGEAMLAAFAVEKIHEWSEQMGEAAEKVMHTGEIFGMTTPEVQGLQAVATAAGMSIDTLTKGMALLDRNMVAAASGAGTAALAFKAVGVSASDGKSQMDTLLAISDKFAEMADGPQKVALAMALFGRAGKEMIPALNLGAEGLRKMDEEGQKYSAGTIDQSNATKELRDWLTEVNAKGVELAETNNQTSVAMQGLGNVMTDAFAPMLTQLTAGVNELIQSFVESYREGGAVAVVLDVIAGVVQVLGTAIGALWEIWLTVWDSVGELVSTVANTIADAVGVKIPNATMTATQFFNVFRDAIVVAKDVIVIAIDIIMVQVNALVSALRIMAKVAEDAMHLNWSAIASDWQKGFDDLESRAEATTKKIVAAAKEMQAALAAAGSGELLGGEKKGEEHKRTGAAPDLTKQPKAKKPKAEKSRMSEWQQDITDQKTAFEMMQQAQGTHEEWSLEKDAEYWQNILARADLSARERLSVEEKFLSASKAATAQKLADIEVATQKELDAASKGHAERIAILAGEAAQIKALVGDKAKAYQDVENKITAETRAAAEERRQIEDISAKDKIKAAQGSLAAEESAAKFRVTMGEETEKQLIAQERQFLADKKAIDDQQLNDQIAIATKGSVEEAKLKAQKLDLERQYNQQLIALDQQAALQRTQIERTAINQIASSWSNAFGQMLTMQTSFGQGVQSMWRGITSMISSAIESMLTKWMQQQLTALITGQAQQKASAISQVTSNSGIAASAAYASTAAIPIVGPELAPAAAATALAGSMSFLSIASASGGWGRVPFDGAMTELHREEMVLPANLATPIRAMASSYNSEMGGGAPMARGGDTHLHVHATDADSVKRLFSSEDGIAGLKAGLRKAGAGLKY